jgi:hypothetical protein
MLFRVLMGCFRKFRFISFSSQHDNAMLNSEWIFALNYEYAMFKIMHNTDNVSVSIYSFHYLSLCLESATYT